MKNLPDIDPEVLGLLEEIVADPRSAMRLVPRKALRSWFDTNEVARASEISTTRAERHLIDEHRESLAALLCEAAWIAYWKAPVLKHRPVGEDGQIYSPCQREPGWLEKARRFVGSRSGGETDVQLLLKCLTELPAESAYFLARASLSIVPNDRTRCYVALTVPIDQPRSAIRLFRYLSDQAQSGALRSEALLCLSWRLCSTGQILEALALYRRHTAQTPESIYGRAYALNLSCYIGDLGSAQAEANELSRLLDARDPRLLDLAEVVASWARLKTIDDLAVWRTTYSSITGAGEEVARVLGGKR